MTRTATVRRSFAFCLVTLIGVTSQLLGQDPGLAAKIDAYMAPIVENKDFAGAVLVARGDSVLFRRAYGESNIDAGARHTPETQFRIASLTKTFTAAAIVILAERGALDLEDPLSRFLPNFLRGNNITILHLLRHESGLANPDYKRSFDEQIDLRELVRRIASEPTLFEPGTDGRYSNAGFNVLARVIEVASGVSYTDFLRQTIWEPLGMNATGQDARGPREALGYLPGPPPIGLVEAPRGDFGFSIGSGSVYSTIGDLHRWARAIHRETLFSRSSLGYPYGWGKLGENRDEGLEQSGLTTGYATSLFVWFPDSLYTAILGNVEYGRWTSIPRDIARLVRGEEVEVPAIRRVGEIASGALERYAGFYTHDERRILIRTEDGHLWLYSDDWPVPKYLSPTPRAGEFEVRSDFGRIVFEPADHAPASALHWVFGPDSRSTYARVDSAGD